MLDRIKKLFSDEKGNPPSNSVIFWNVMYYVLLGVCALINFELFFLIYFISSVFGLAIMFDNKGEFGNNWWGYTTIISLFLLLIIGVGYITVYPIFKLVTWFNNLLNDKTCLKHDYKRITKTPFMVNDINSYCSFVVKYECNKCGKIKTGNSDTYVGMRIQNMTNDEK